MQTQTEISALSRWRRNGHRLDTLVEVREAERQAWLEGDHQALFQLRRLSKRVAPAMHATAA